MEKQRRGRERAADKADDTDDATPRDDAEATEGDESSSADDEDLGGLEEFEVHDGDADAADAASDASRSGAGAGGPAPSGAAPETGKDASKGGGKFVTNHVLRIAAVAATVAGVVLAAVGLWKLLFSKPLVPEGIEAVAEETRGSVDDWAAVEPSSTTSSGAADMGGSMNSFSVPVEEPALVSEPPEPVAAPEPVSAPQLASEPEPESTAEPTVAEPTEASEPVRAEPWRSSASRPAKKRAVAPKAARVESVPALVREPSAYEQLIRSRQKGAASVDADDTGGQARASARQAFQKADQEFARFLVEDAANIPTFLGASKWQAVRDSGAYVRTVYAIYDHVLSVDDKLRLYSAYTKAHERPTSAPAQLRQAEIPTPSLDEVRKDVWQDRRADVQVVVRTTP